MPWVLYHERFGDLGVLRDAYPSMRDWVDAVVAVTSHPGLLGGAMQLGDWLDPDAPPDKPQKAKVDGDLVASAHLAKSLRIVAAAAGSSARPTTGSGTPRSPSAPAPHSSPST